MLHLYVYICGGPCKGQKHAAHPTTSNTISVPYVFQLSLQNYNIIYMAKQSPTAWMTPFPH